MSINASHRGHTDGALSKRYQETGQCPETDVGVLVIMAPSRVGSPFTPFAQPSATVVAKAFPSDYDENGNGPPPILDPLERVNEIIAKYVEMDGIEGCKNDRICGFFPPYLCFLPLVCCLGGCCAVVMHTKSKVVRMTKEIHEELVMISGAARGYTWSLCSGDHASKVDMSQVNSAAGEPREGGNPTVVETLVWIEVRIKGRYE